MDFRAKGVNAAAEPICNQIGRKQIFYINKISRNNVELLIFFIYFTPFLKKKIPKIRQFLGVESCLSKRNISGIRELEYKRTSEITYFFVTLTYAKLTPHIIDDYLH